MVLHGTNLGSLACLWVQLSASLCGQLPVLLCLCNAALQSLKPGRPLPRLGSSEEKTVVGKGELKGKEVFFEACNESKQDEKVRGVTMKVQCLLRSLLPRMNPSCHQHTSNETYSLQVQAIIDLHVYHLTQYLILNGLQAIHRVTSSQAL